RAKFFKSGFERVADLPLHVHGNANAARAGQLFDARSDVHAVAVDVAVAMDHVTDVDPDLELDPPVGCDVRVAFGQGTLNFDRALRSFQGAAEFDEEGIADGFDFNAMKRRKDFAEQATMFFQQLQGKLVVALGQRAITNHVGKHDGGELALFGVGAHGSVNPILRIKGAN